MGLERVTTVAYTGNVSFILKLDNILTKKGYNKVLLDAYIAKDNRIIKELTNNLAQDNTYFDVLAQYFKQGQNMYVEAFKTGNWAQYMEFSDLVANYLDRLR